MKLTLPVLAIATFFLAGCTQSSVLAVTSFETCVVAGNQPTNSFPAECSTPDGQTFVQELAPDQSTTTF